MKSKKILMMEILDGNDPVEIKPESEIELNSSED